MLLMHRPPEHGASASRIPPCLCGTPAPHEEQVRAIHWDRPAKGNEWHCLDHFILIDSAIAMETAFSHRRS